MWFSLIILLPPPPLLPVTCFILGLDDNDYHCEAEERSVSASRYPLLPNAIRLYPTNQPQHRSPSFPDFFMSSGTHCGLDGLTNGPYKLHASPGVLFNSPQPVWTDLTQSDHP
ncbi:hypothetical protein FGIG_04942 [Fasciola gigantica]|uniref:Uncharacterized protein n=1 Tax=Fasciola gigantica TaxID=46835 RepID=A0A504YTK7_FASGI|nr:hypothetical protein FGIG_04942 [Fasciola gigantica]